MKATVWTSWGSCVAFDVESMDKAKPRCIFRGQIEFVPRKDDYVQLDAEKGAHRVRHVLVDLINNDVEITIIGNPSEKDYPTVEIPT